MTLRPVLRARAPLRVSFAGGGTDVAPFTEREGGVEHVGADNMAFGRDYIADWFADTLGGHTA